MKKWGVLGLLVLVTLPVYGFAGGNYPTNRPQVSSVLRDDRLEEEWDIIKDEYEDVVQEVQIYSAEGELLFTITENKEIYKFVMKKELDKWDYSVSEIPQGAIKLCAIISSKEKRGEMVTDAIETVYYDKNGYYQLTEIPSLNNNPVGGSINSFAVKMSGGAARYLIELAGLELPPDVFSGGNTGYVLNDETAGSIPFDELTYEGMLAASEVNRLEILSGSDIIRSISDNTDIYAFRMSLNYSEWRRIDSIPDTVEQIGAIIFYQEGRRVYAGEMKEQWRLVLYRDDDNYYVDKLIADIGYLNNALPNPERFLIPDEIGAKLLAE